MGEHTITIKLRDDGDPKLTTAYSIQLIVFEVASETFTDAYIEILKDPKPTIDSFYIDIKEINEEGLTQVTFSQEIVPSINVGVLNDNDE